MLGTSIKGELFMVLFNCIISKQLHNAVYGLAVGQFEVGRAITR